METNQTEMIELIKQLCADYYEMRTDKQMSESFAMAVLAIKASTALTQKEMKND